MAFGVDTFSSHLDSIRWADFQSWNANLAPLFAGRNFLGGRFLWAPGEATTALQAPSPGDFSNLQTLVPRIAPIQASSAARQQVTGHLGTLFGHIDAQAVCGRLAATLATGELTLPSARFVHVYLQVDPTAPFSADYWSGWADTVNYHAAYRFPTSLAMPIPQQPFRPCILCAFAKDGQVLRVDPHVPDALDAARRQHPELFTACFGLWADAADLFAELEKPGAVIDWTRFAPTPVPVRLWRFARTLLKADGTPISAQPPALAADAVNEVGPQHRLATDFMLDTWQWQPSNAVANLGFTTPEPVKAHLNAIVAQGMVPDVARHETCGTFRLPGGPLHVIGRYIRESATSAAHPTFTEDDAIAVSGTALRLFTTFERAVGATTRAYYDPKARHGFDDGMIAFPHAADVLRQPANTPIFFAIDWAPDDEATAEDKQWITSYIAGVQDAYDVYLGSHPTRPYLIGVYGSGLELGWFYEQGIAAGFWQAGSMCRTGSSPPAWPWPHATRWQHMVATDTFDPKIGGIVGEDLDSDWGDGGDWSRIDAFNLELIDVENQHAIEAFERLRQRLGNLLNLLRD